MPVALQRGRNQWPSGAMGSWKLELQGSASDLLPFKLMFYNNSINNY